MRMCKLVGAAASVLAAIAFVGTSPAFGFTVWQEDGVNVTSSTNVNVADDGNGLIFIKTSGSAAFTAKCTAASGLAAVNTSGAGTFSSISFGSCSRVPGLCPTPISVAPVNEPWTLKISNTRLSFGAFGSNSGWVISCNSMLTFTCTASSWSLALSNLLSAVEASWDTSTSTYSCNDGGTLTVSGAIVFSIPGHALQVH